MRHAGCGRIPTRPHHAVEGARCETQRRTQSQCQLPVDQRQSLLDGSETIEGISLYPEKSGRVAVYFDNSPVALPDRKKPDAGETKLRTRGMPSGGATETTVEPDWIKIIGNNAEEEALIRKQIEENIRNLTPPMQRRDSFDGTNVPRFVPYLCTKKAWSQAGSLVPSPLNSPLPSRHPSQKKQL